MAKVLQRLDILLFANTAQYRTEMRETQESTTTMFGAIKADAANMAKVGAAAFASMAVAGTAAIGVMIKEQIELAGEITTLAKVSNTGVESMQKLAIAAKAVGVEQDTLGDIYKDTQDKIGDFLSTGGGGMADFFDNIAPQIGLTADQFRELSGPDALQLYYNGLQEANLSQSELVFYMEAMASDASALIPLLHDNGAGFKVWAEAAENAGAVMDEETIRATRELQAANDLMMLSVDGAKKQFTSAFIPVLADVANHLVGSANASEIAREAGEGLVKAFKLITNTGLGVVAIVQVIAKSIGGLAEAIAQLGNGVDWDSPYAFFQLGRNFLENNRSAAVVFDDVVTDIAETIRKTNKLMDDINALGTGPRAANQYVTAAANQRDLSRELGITGQAYQAQQKAADDAAKAAEKSAAKTAKLAKAQSLIPKAASDAILAGAKQLGVNPNDLAAVISFETSGTFRTNIRNPTSSGTGLIQFMQKSDGKDDGKYFGMTRSQFGNLLPLQQMEYVVKYLKGRGISSGSGVGEIYDAVAGYGYKKGTQAYNLNKVWDVNNDGVVAKGEAVTGKRFKAHIKDYYGDGVAIAQQSIAQINQEETRAAAEQARIAEQQAKERTAIRYDFANKAVQIEMQLAAKIEKINASGFNEDERQAFTIEAKQRSATELANYEDTQAKKLAAFSDFSRSERDLIVQNAMYSAAEVIRDEELTGDQRDQALEFIKQKAQYELNQLDLTHDQQMQYATQLEQTDIERITNQYALERREIQLTINMDEDLRKAKIDALNQAEQLALSERNYAFERELRDLNSIGQSSLAALRADYADQRRILDARTDISDDQKSTLRNAQKGKEIYDTGQLQKGARDGFNAQQADINGTGANYAIAQQYQARLDIIQDAVKAEVLAVEQAEQAKYAARLEFETASTQLTLSSAEQTAASLAGSFKTMLGEQNIGYKLMFLGQQSFVMASAGLNMYEAWGDAMAEGATMSQKLIGAATIAAEFGRIISAASSMTLELPGYQVGGFTASGDDSDPVGLVHANEFVANAPTTRKFRPELEAMHNGTYDRNASKGGDINVNVTVSMEGKSSVESDSAMGKQIGQGLAAVVVGEVRKMMRPNGEMDRVYAKR